MELLLVVRRNPLASRPRNPKLLLQNKRFGIATGAGSVLALLTQGILGCSRSSIC
jgi:hypothetical protein